MIAQAQMFSQMVKNYGHLFDYQVHGGGLIAAMVRHSQQEGLGR